MSENKTAENTKNQQSDNILEVSRNFSRILQ